MHSFKEFIRLDESARGIFKFIKDVVPEIVDDMFGSPANKPGRFISTPIDNAADDVVPGGLDPFGRPRDLPDDPFQKVDAILDALDEIANGLYDNLGSLFSDFFATLGQGYTGAFDAFRMMLRNLVADPDLLRPEAAASLLDYLFDADVIISISEDGTQMFFSHNGATAAQNEVMDVFFNGAIQSVPGLLEMLIDAFPNSFYG